MEGFVKLKIDKFLRALLTRSVAIVPALAIAFMDEGNDFNHYLNILQAIQLPFALIPLLRFNSYEQIIGAEVIEKWKLVVLVILASLIVGANYYGIYLLQFKLTDFQIMLVVLVALLYFYFMIILIF